MGVALRVSSAMAAALVSSCAGGDPSPAGRTDATPQVVTALCDARDKVGEGAAAAESIFMDRAHDALHDLARRSAEIDREATARLLEAKHAVEAAFETPPSRRALAAELERLIDATRRAAEVTAGSASDCPDGGDDA
jgi:hypothetical protein